MSKNNNYTTGNLSDYEYFKDHYKLIAIDLSKQIELEDLKKIMQQCSSLLRKNKKPLLIFHKTLQWLFDMYKNGNSKDCKFTQ